MNALFLTMIYVVFFALAWLVPLYFICKWAERAKKDHRIVGLVGLLTSWPIALIVALLLPKLSDEKLAELARRSERAPMGETVIALWGLGACSLMMLVFMAWLNWGF